MVIVLKILNESFRMALRELWVNKLRTFLTLLGISIGIFCVISIFSAVDSLENNLRSSFNKLGNNIIYVTRSPWVFDKDYPWWKYQSRPNDTYNEMKLIDEHVKDASATAIVMYIGGKTAKYKDYSIENVVINGVSPNYDNMQSFDFTEGRFFNAQESNSGENVAIIGSGVRDELFKSDISPLGQEVEMLGGKVRVVGVFAKEGESIIHNSTDNLIMMPFSFMKTKVDLNHETEPFIMVKAADGVALDELKDEIRGVMRSARSLPPKKEDNFALNQISVITNQIESVFGVVDVVGLIIGGFAILVGGFGIANIMFVSVKERTNIIGIKKALGAKNYFIMLEFLLESVVLAIIGGLLGLVLVYLILLVANNVIDFNFVLNTNNILIGIGISAAIGIISGIIPALAASRLDPVEAIRSK